MTRVLAVRTRDGHYLEFRTLRAQTDKGEIEIEIDSCVIAEILNVEEPPTRLQPSLGDLDFGRDHPVDRTPRPHRISANGIDSDEAFGSPGG